LLIEFLEELINVAYIISKLWCSTHYTSPGNSHRLSDNYKKNRNPTHLEYIIVAQVFTEQLNFSNLLTAGRETRKATEKLHKIFISQGVAMRLLAFIITIWITCLCYTTAAEGRTRAHAVSVTGPTALAANINAAIHKISPYTRVGISIKSMKYGDSLYVKDDKSLFVPASTLKVFTAEAALLYLGSNFRFSTRFVSDTNNISGGTLYGNLYLVNSGDPSLTFDDLSELIASLKAHQINQIAGNVYIDNTAYDQVTTGPGWLWNDRRFCYAAPISASIINHNCTSYRPKYSSSITEALSETQGTHDSTRGAKTCFMKMDDGDGGTLTINDCEASSSGGKKHYTYAGGSVINDVILYDKSLLQDLFARYGISVRGNIGAGKAAVKNTELARHESKPLHDLITEMLKKSDNIIAGSLFKKIGEMYTHRPGTWESGGTAVARILSQQAALDIWRISLMDGSGLSRYNQVTPAQMLKVLDFTYHNDATNYNFISALPIAGIDGTLKRRMKNIAWKVRAKTGTMQGVVSLAGYAMSADKEPLAFVIMINGRNGSVWQYRELEDRIMQYLTHYTR
jgi:D-alanyl-D-alanine carboxypeptidase/D-alanyl-D-alanine-endopeptidase (penicillin-binding protein 4)